MKQDSAELERLVDLVTAEVNKRLEVKPSFTPDLRNAVKVPAPLFSPTNLASMIDHTLLKPDASADQIKKLCEEAAKYHFATVCVNSSNVGLASKLLEGSGVKAIAVVGFPLGASTPASKAFETLEAIRAGSEEIDMVINIGALKSRDYKLVFDDIKSVVSAAGNIPVKVILETSTLTDEEKIIGCALSKASGAAFVKTSTGFSGGGATVEDIKLMRRVVGPEMGVKASGGVRTLEDAKKFIEAGANRLGASSSVDIVTGVKTDAKGY
jgi:deoxyribose-phosphate aldolase